MRKIAKIAMACLLAVLMVTMSFQIPASAASTTGSYVRVRLDSMGTPGSVTMTVNGAYYIEEDASIKLTQGKSYTFKVSEGKVTLDGKTLGESVTLIRCFSESSTNHLSIMNSYFGYTINYPGNMTMEASGSTMRLYCQLHMEDYVCGVLIGEMGNSKPLEALKAQAVAARTFAMSRSLSTNYSYDVTDTSASSQVYKGYVSSYMNIINAVKGTKGQVLYWNGVISDGIYSCSNGGQTQLASAKWNMKDTYHELKEDPYDLLSSAHRSYSYVFGKEGGKSTDSRINTQVIAAAAANLNAKADDIKVLGYTSVTPYGTPDGYPSGSRVHTHIKVGVVLSVKGKRKETTVTFKYTTFREPFLSDYSVLKEMRNIMDLTENDEAITLTIRGWGNGVGLSQSGAIARAQDGHTYKQILNFYYNGCNVAALNQVTNSLPALPGTAEADKVEDDDGLEVVGYGIVNSTSSAKVYTKADSSSNVRGTLNPNRVVEVFEKGKTWTKIRYNSAVGYVSTSLLTIQTENPLVPIIDTGLVQVESSLYVRLEPNTNCNALTTLSNGETVHILEKGDKFHRIAFGEYIGYVSSSYIKLLNTAPTPTPTVKPTAKPEVILTGIIKTSGSSLNVRSAPSSSANRVGGLSNGTTVDIYEEVDGWYKIAFGGGVGYVSKSYVTASKVTTPTPKPTATPTATPKPTDTPKPTATPTATSKPTATPESEDVLGVITVSSTGSAPMRKSSSSSATKVASLRKNDIVTVLKQGSKWHQVEYDGKTGYVSAKYVDVLDSSTQPGQVTAGKNVRKNASSKGKKLGTLSKGARVVITGSSGNFFKIQYNNGIGYISKTNVKFVEATTDTVTKKVQGKVTVSSKGSAPVRKSTSSKATKVGSLYKNYVVTVLEQGTKWHKISYKNITGYVSAKYIKITS